MWVRYRLHVLAATWNVNSLNARVPRVEQWLTEVEPDVLCLQETKLAEDAFPFELFAELGYEVVHHGQGQWNGVAIAARIGIEEPIRGFAEGIAPDEDARLVSARCGSVRVHSVYVPNGREVDHEQYHYKLDWLQRLRTHLEATVDPSDEVIVAGDWNIAPTDIDVWDRAVFEGSTHVTDRERAALDAVKEWGPGRHVPGPLSRAGAVQLLRLPGRSVPQAPGNAYRLPAGVAAAGRAVGPRPGRPQRPQGQEAERPRSRPGRIRPVLTSLDHHQLLVFWVQLLLLWSVARLLGAAARRLGLPSVVGELCAGLLLGPSFFGWIWPRGFDWFLPGEPYAAEQSALLLGVVWLSAAFLLVVAGYETDLDLIRRLGRAAALVTMGSIVVPFVGGLFVGWIMPELFYGEIDGQAPSRLVFTLFIAVSVAVSALAVVAKILGDLGLMRRDVGQITIAVGMANDLVGWIILGVIAGLAASGELSVTDVGFTVVGLGLFLVGALTLGQRAVDAALRAVRRDGRNLQGALTVTVAFMLAFGVLTQALGVEAVLGTFIAGVLLARSRYEQIESEHVIEDLTSVLFAPLFFATAGLRLDLSLLQGSALAWALVLLVVALGLKFAGAFAGARWAGLTTREGMVSSVPGSTPAARWRSSSPPSGSRSACSTRPRSRSS